MTSDVIQEIDTGHLNLLSFLDLSAAFDTVDHSILLTRIKVSFGLTGTVVHWFESFVRSSTHRIKVGSSFSDIVSSNCGVPQGSVLGPLLFSLYVADLVRIVLCFNLHLHMYADDVLFYGSCLPANHTDLTSRIYVFVH